MAKARAKKEKEEKKIVLRLGRDDEGNLKPAVGISPTLAIPVKVLPMTYGQSRNYESFGEALFNWTPEDKLRVINDHILEPEIHIKNLKDMEDNFDPWTIEDLVQSVFVYSGMSRLFGESTEGNVPAEDEKIISA